MIRLTSQFQEAAALPIEYKMVVADLTARDALDATERYDGLQTYVISTAENWQLQGGVTNADWVLISGAGGVITLQTNGVNNGDQTLLNLIDGTNISITDDGLGGVTIDGTGIGVTPLTYAAAATLAGAGNVIDGEYYLITDRADTGILVTGMPDGNSYSLKGNGGYLNPDFANLGGLVSALPSYAGVSGITGITAQTVLGVWNPTFEYRQLDYTTLVGGTFSVGDTITDLTTGATGTVIADDGVSVMTVLKTSYFVSFGSGDTIDNGGGVTATVFTLGTPVIASGDIVFWNGEHYQCINSGYTDGTDPSLNTNGYTLLPKATADVGYIEEWDAIEFDFGNDWVQRRADRRGNIIAYGYLTEQILINGANAIDQFQWGNSAGCFDNISNQGLLNNMNFGGVTSGNELSDFAIIADNIAYNSLAEIVGNKFGTKTAISTNTFNNTVSSIKNNVLTLSSSIQGNDFRANGTIVGNNLITSSYISSNVFYGTKSGVNNNDLADGSSIVGNSLYNTDIIDQNRVFGGSSISSNIMNGLGCAIITNNLENTSSINANTFSANDGAILSNNLYGSSIQENTLDDTSIITTNIMESALIYSNTFGVAAYIEGSKMSESSSIQFNILSGGAYLSKNTLEQSSFINANTLLDNAFILENMLGKESNIRDNVMGATFGVSANVLLGRGSSINQISTTGVSTSAIVADNIVGIGSEITLNEMGTNSSISSNVLGDTAIINANILAASATIVQNNVDGRITQNTINISSSINGNNIGLSAEIRENVMSGNVNKIEGNSLGYSASITENIFNDQGFITSNTLRASAGINANTLEYKSTIASNSVGSAGSISSNDMSGDNTYISVNQLGEYSAINGNDMTANAGYIATCNLCAYSQISSDIFGTGASFEQCTFSNGGSVQLKTLSSSVNVKKCYFGLLCDQTETWATDITSKRCEPGFSNFEQTISITGATTLPITTVFPYVGIFNLTSSHATETIDTITNESPFVPYRLQPASGLTVTFTGTAIGSIAADKIALETATFVANGTNFDWLLLQQRTSGAGATYSEQLSAANYI